MDGEVNGEGSVPGDKRHAKLAVVIFGIALFVAGFAITISSPSGLESASGSGSSHGVLSSDSGAGSISLLVLVGIVVSLAGVLVATVGPMTSFIQAKTK